MLLQGQTESSPITNDRRNKYGPCAAETYFIRDMALMTVYYSNEGTTCTVKIPEFNTKSLDSLEKLLEEVAPLRERGREIRSIGLTSGQNGISSCLYDRVAISSTTSQEPDGFTVSATVRWSGIDCILPEQQPPHPSSSSN